MEGDEIRGRGSLDFRMSRPPVRHSFKTTCWTDVRLALGQDETSQQALAALCENYWFPIYAFIRRSGKSPHDAEDLTQEFFERFIGKEVLTHADPAKGRLRTFLLACVRHLLADAHDRAQAKKRGAALLINFDSREAEERYVAEPTDDLSPDRLFQRRWVLALLGETLGRLQQEWMAKKDARLFEALLPYLETDSGVARSYEELALEFSIPVGTLKNYVFRLRKRWQEILFEQVAATLDNPTEVEIRAELSELWNCL